MPEYPVHRCRFVEYVPSPVLCIRFSPETTTPYLAVCRENGNIELWNVLEDWNLERIIYGRKDISIQTLAWSFGPKKWKHADSQIDDPLGTLSGPHRAKLAVGRLFSGGTNGLVEWDLDMLRLKICVESCGPVLEMASSTIGDMLAVACKDQALKLFSVQDIGLSLHKALDRQDGCFLSVVWSNDDRYIATGSSDGLVRVWNSKTFQMVQKIDVDVSGSINVQSVAFIDTAVLVSGDSAGTVQFWDMEKGTSLGSCPSHDAGVLSVAAVPGQNLVYSSGVDQKVVQFKYSNESGRWVEMGYRRIHTHQVRSISVCNHSFLKIFVSAGQDARLIVHDIGSFPRERILNPFLPGRIVQMARTVGRMAVRHHDSCEIWSIEDGAPRNQFCVRMAHNITSFGISGNGNMIAVSTSQNLKLFVRKEDVWTRVHSELGPSRLINFSSDSTLLVSVTCTNEIQVCSLESIDTSIRSVQVMPKGPVVSGSISRDNQYFALATLDGIDLFSLDILKLVSSPPNYASNHLQLICFHPTRDILVAVSTMNAIYLYDIRRKTLTNWSREYSDHMPVKWDEKVMGIDIDPENPDHVLVWGCNFASILDVGARDSQKMVHVAHVPQYILYCGFFNCQQLLMVERPWDLVLKILPPPFQRTKYGN